MTSWSSRDRCVPGDLSRSALLLPTRPGSPGLPGLCWSHWITANSQPSQDGPAGPGRGNLTPAAPAACGSGASERRSSPTGQMTRVTCLPAWFRRPACPSGGGGSPVHGSLAGRGFSVAQPPVVCVFGQVRELQRAVQRARAPVEPSGYSATPPPTPPPVHATSVAQVGNVLGFFAFQFLPREVTG